MLTSNKISKVFAREIIDSRGNPTVEATVILEDGSIGCGASPSGASTGKYEAHELRDGDEKRYNGKGVLRAVENVNSEINRELKGIPCDIYYVDSHMIHLDGTENKKRLGANATLAVSIAAARAAASHYGIPLYRYIGGASAKTLPVPMMNILNGGAHAANNIEIQEFMIMPMYFGTFSEALRAGCEIYHKLGSLLKKDGHSTTVGDEGGFAPNLNGPEEALGYIVRAIEESGYGCEKVKIALDAASSEWANGSSYHLPKNGETHDSISLIDEWDKLSSKYPIVSIEDGLGEDDHDGWKAMSEKLDERMLLVGDDYFVTNPKKLSFGIRNGAGNAILIKPNQIGTLTETIEVVSLAKENGYKTIISHRSGETSDTIISDLSVGLNSGYIKTGAPARAERCAKYNKLLKIEEDLHGNAAFGESFR